MAYYAWIGAIVVGLICLGAGILGRMKTKGSTAATLYLMAMAVLLVGTVTAPVSPLLDHSRLEQSRLLVKIFVTAVLVTEVLLWSVTLVFPVERPLRFKRVSLSGVMLFVWLGAALVLGATSTSSFIGSTLKLPIGTTQILIVNSNIMIILSTIFIVKGLPGANQEGRQGGKIYLLGLWVVHLSAIAFMLDIYKGIEFGAGISLLKAVIFIAGVGFMGVLNGFAIASNRLVLKGPTTEMFLSGSKSKYKLLLRHAYLVEETKPDFAFKIFTDILKGRCSECENDESFACESIDCSACRLPCPCRDCTKYKSRPQGLIVTRQFATDIRARYFIQTTPILWLSTVQGPQNMDPSKLALLTDYIINFMESAQNGVVLVDGIEYMVTSNDFQKTQKAVDRWTETAMTSKCRLILSVDPKAFDVKELATLERDRETVRPDAKESWRVFPERI
jgi:Protein of unknown function (DUF835)